MTAQDDFSTIKDNLTDWLVDMLGDGHIDVDDQENYPALGDLVLMRGKFAIVAYQFAKRLKFFPYSHAAISLGPRLYVDAMPSHGLRVKRWADLKKSARFKVFRHQNDFGANPGKIAQIVKNYGRPYSVAGKLKHHSIIQSRAILDIKFGNSIFCSEFIGEIYSRTELGILDSRTILPCDLKNITNMVEWRDVTDIYENYTEDEFESEVQDAIERGLAVALEAMGPVNSFQYGMGKISHLLERARSETASLKRRRGIGSEDSDII